MKTEGRFDYITLSNHDEHFLNATPLDAHRVEVGDIRFVELDLGDHYSITKLFVGPGAKVKRCKHTDHSEWLLDLEGKTSEFCAMGGINELENICSIYWSVVISVKQW